MQAKPAYLQIWGFNLTTTGVHTYVCYYPRSSSWYWKPNNDEALLSMIAGKWCDLSLNL